MTTEIKIVIAKQESLYTGKWAKRHEDWFLVKNQSEFPLRLPFEAGWKHRLGGTQLG